MVTKIGADPEVFVVDKAGALVSAIGRVPGMKHAVHKTKHGAIHCDNVLAELNFPAAKSAEEFIKNARGALCDLQEVLNEFDCGVSIITSAHMPDKELMHPAALEFGCEGDLDAWGIDQVQAPQIARVGNLRTAGGHIHIGYNVRDYGPDKVARACDIQIGLVSVLLDTDTERRSMYGQSGRYRPKPYGSEYRVPSNFWLKSDDHMAWVFEAAQTVMARINEYDDMIGSFKEAMAIKETINKGDAKAAVELCNKYGVEIPWHLIA